MKNLIKLTIAIAILLTSGIATGQELTVTGTVVDSRGVPLPGTNITIVNSTKGAQTDFDGFFTIEANKGDQLMLSYVGFYPQTVTVQDETKLEITLEENVEGLDQIVIIGYGSSSKTKIATSIGTIRGEDLTDIKFPSIQSLFSGQITGVQASQLSGRVESGIKVRVRGVATIGASQEPLYVLDGVPLINEDESINNSPINPLIGLNPDDIDSIDFLKDAAAAAIYGARGTNGVIIITTKKGNSSKPKITLNTSTGLNFTTKKRDFLNAQQYIELYTEA
ncbi:MAG: SusC/RagA family TonB-linked outer membrane protein, partial [Aquimarina sp.]|nr:SusC/RagA family TonB-linked outer membrane protein [Aquimarina sp.]